MTAEPQDGPDLDSASPPMFVGVHKHSALKEIAIACEAELNRTQIYPRTEAVLRKILATAERGLQHG